MSGKVVKVSGPLVVATGLADANMSDVVRVGPQRLIGEILTMKGDTASIQVYEETSGLGPGAVVETTGAPMSVELGPGMIEGIYDGIQRPLETIMAQVGSCITRGVEVPAVDHEKKWEFTATAKVGDTVIGGDIIGTVPETSVVLHKIMVPPTLKGTIVDIKSGSFNVTETIAIKTALGDRAKDAFVSSTKSMTGHMLGAAGAMEAIVCIKALEEGILPPTINLLEQDPACDLNYVPNQAVSADITLALSNSLGFGGHNACLAFRKV